jgi:hypothetical protein
MLVLRHSQFTIDYPAEWTVYGEQQSPSVTIAPNEGLVQSSAGRTALGYGAVVGFGSSSGSLARDTDSLVAELRASNPSMQIVGTARRIQVNGEAGLLTELRAPSPYGGAERDLLVTLRRPEGLLYVVFVAPEGSTSEVSPVFESMYASIRF